MLRPSKLLLNTFKFWAYFDWHKYVISLKVDIKRKNGKVFQEINKLANI